MNDNPCVKCRWFCDKLGIPYCNKGHWTYSSVYGKVWALDHPEEDIVKTRFSHCHDGEDFEPNRVEKAKRFLHKFLSMK